MKKCYIIYNEPGANALADELDVLDQVEHVEKHLLELDVDVKRKGITADFMNEISSLAAEKPDFVFNLVESINNKGELNYFIPALLNMYSIPYSGNPVEAMFTTTSKTLASKTLKNAGIRNAASFFPSQAAMLQKGKKYILKPIWEDGSLGITADSVFDFDQSALERLKKLDDTHWFIEEYIDGREFNVSVLAGSEGPQVMPFAEIVFVDYADRPKIIDFKAKWEEDTFEYENTVREFPGDSLSLQLQKDLRATALSCWHLFGLKGYARVDVRTDSKENVYVIEINANPCISPNGGYVAATRQAGLTFSEVLKRIINDLNG
jgi:D-alanine-D-alanine ligase